MKYDEQVNHTLWALSFFFFLIVLPWFGHVFSKKGRFGHKRKLPVFFLLPHMTCPWHAHQIPQNLMNSHSNILKPHDCGLSRHCPWGSTAISQLTTVIVPPGNHHVAICACLTSKFKPKDVRFAWFAWHSGNYRLLDYRFLLYIL